MSDIIAARLDELKALIERYPVYLPVSAAAELLHMTPETLRASIEQGTCPFGFSWRLGERSAYKIPTLTFYAWYTRAVSVPA